MEIAKISSSDYEIGRKDDYLVVCMPYRLCGSTLENYFCHCYTSSPYSKFVLDTYYLLCYSVYMQQLTGKAREVDRYMKKHDERIRIAREKKSEIPGPTEAKECMLAMEKKHITSQKLRLWVLRPVLV